MNLSGIVPPIVFRRNNTGRIPNLNLNEILTKSFVPNLLFCCVTKQIFLKIHSIHYNANNNQGQGK